MVPSWLPAVILLSAPAVGVGFLVGKYHIRRLALTGGETRYPELVERAVEAYRDDNHVEDLHWLHDD